MPPLGPPSVAPPASAAGSAANVPTWLAATHPINAPTEEHPLDFSGLQGLAIHCLQPPTGSWRGAPLHPFPGGLGSSLERAAATLTSLSLSYVTFQGSDGDVLGKLTGLHELSIV
ncbi:hypothetical protein GPECTOR_5g32 [Gonium pectorale]|uniref:Uncharacterized protein n=1 Tax=Gonium pectorale TaxID=33097 RepID=A0A150GX21_GONPE|nr:hypothetical protein GPECTOR_5g32 [Gonium pectorale]|eukprot:KXZ54228.1 hypothetical protein GPECTOR_5g32 [Gonium pectorale]